MNDLDDLFEVAACNQYGEATSLAAIAIVLNAICDTLIRIEGKIGD